MNDSLQHALDSLNEIAGEVRAGASWALADLQVFLHGLAEDPLEVLALIHECDTYTVRVWGGDVENGPGLSSYSCETCADLKLDLMAKQFDRFGVVGLPRKAN